MASSKKTAWRDGLRKEAPGKWLARITWVDAAGKRHDTERVVHADTKLEALQKRAAIQVELGGGGPGWTVAQALDAFLATLGPGSLHSWGSYSRRLRADFGPRKLSSIKGDELQRWLVTLPVSDSTANSIRSMCMSLWTSAKKQGQATGPSPAKETSPRRTPRSPAQELADMESPPRRALVGDEVPRFLRALPDDLRPLMTVQLMLGCRFGEASALEWRDVDLATGHVRIRQTQYYGKVGPVKSRKLRWSAIGPGTLEMLRAHKERMAVEKWPGWERWVFPRPLTSAAPRPHDMWAYPTVRDWVLKVQQELGIELVSRTHSMRHTNVTTGEIQRQLALDASLTSFDASLHRSMVGHSSQAMTATYTEQSALPHARMAAKLERAMLGEPVGEARENRADDAEEGTPT